MKKYLLILVIISVIILASSSTLDFIEPFLETINSLPNFNPLNISLAIDENNICPYKELCLGGYQEKNNRVYCNVECNRDSYSSCNYNRLCEGFESQDCLDCQCFDGLLCHNICYRSLPDNIICENNFLIDESRKVPENALEFEINFPKFIESGKWEKGNIIIINNNDKGISTSLYFLFEGLEADTKLPDKTEIKPNERKIIGFGVRGLEISGYVTKGKILEQEYNTGRLKVSTNKNSLEKEFIIYDSDSVKCGEGHFNYKGICIGTTFFLDADCESGSNCIDRLDFWLSQNQYLKPKGNITVGFAIINIPEPNQTYNNFLGLTSNITNWFRLESIKYTGKSLVNISFNHIGNYYFNITDFREDLRFGRAFEKTETYQNLIKIPYISEYDIVIFAVPNLPLYEGEIGGISFQNKFIGLNAAFFTDVSIAHELAHIFGCMDIYDKFYLCKSRWKGSLLCEETGKSNIWNLELGNCASEMGWGDRNHNNIVDIDE